MREDRDYQVEYGRVNTGVCVGGGGTESGSVEAQEQNKGEGGGGVAKETQGSDKDPSDTLAEASRE